MAKASNQNAHPYGFQDQRFLDDQLNNVLNNKIKKKSLHKFEQAIMANHLVTKDQNVEQDAVQVAETWLRSNRAGPRPGLQSSHSHARQASTKATRVTEEHTFGVLKADRKQKIKRASTMNKHSNGASIKPLTTNTLADSFTAGS